MKFNQKRKIYNTPSILDEYMKFKIKFAPHIFENGLRNTQFPSGLGAAVHTLEWPMMVLAIHCSRTPSTRCMDEAMCLLNPARRAPLSGGLIWGEQDQVAGASKRKILLRPSSGLTSPCVSLGTNPTFFFLEVEYVPLHIPPAACLTYCSKLSN